MRAVICNDVGSIDALSIEELPSPVPGAQQILVDVKATSVNFPDALMVQVDVQRQQVLRDLAVATAVSPRNFGGFFVGYERSAGDHSE